MTMRTEDVKHIVVHCSKTTARQSDGLAAVERKCRLRGALSCGYHFVIARDGTRSNGRALTEPGNHLLGHNQSSLAICLVGMPGKATPAQKASLRVLLDILAEQFPNARAVTHEELQPGTGRGCPGFKIKEIHGGT